MEITLKTEFDAKELANIRAQIQQRQSEIKLLGKALDHYMALCDHKGMYRGTDRGGGPDGYCSKCGWSY